MLTLWAWTATTESACSTRISIKSLLNKSNRCSLLDDSIRVIVKFLSKCLISLCWNLQESSPRKFWIQETSPGNKPSSEQKLCKVFAFYCDSLSKPTKKLSCWPAISTVSVLGTGIWLKLIELFVNCYRDCLVFRDYECFNVVLLVREQLSRICMKVVIYLIILDILYF